MKQLLEKLTTLAAYTAAVCTIVILLVTSININCFNKGFYKTCLLYTSPSPRD